MLCCCPSTFIFYLTLQMMVPLHQSILFGVIPAKWSLPTLHLTLTFTTQRLASRCSASTPSRPQVMHARGRLSGQSATFSHRLGKISFLCQQFIFAGTVDSLISYKQKFQRGSNFGISSEGLQLARIVYPYQYIPLVYNVFYNKLIKNRSITSL